MRGVLAVSLAALCAFIILWSSFQFTPVVVGKIQFQPQLLTALTVSPKTLFAILMLAGAIILPGWRKFAWVAWIGSIAGAYWWPSQVRGRWTLTSFDSATIEITWLTQAAALFFIPLYVFARRYCREAELAVRFPLAVSVVFNALLNVLMHLSIRKTEASALGDVITNLIVVRDSKTLYEDAYRFGGIGGFPQVCAAVIVTFWPALLPWRKVSAAKKPSGRLGKNQVTIFYSIAVLVAAFAGLLLTYSRAALVGLSLQLLLMAAMAFSAPLPRRAVFRRNLLAIAVAVFAALLLIPHSFSRLKAVTDFADASVGNRLSAYRAAIDMIQQRPFSGWGIGAFGAWYSHFYEPPRTTIYAYVLAHSTIFDTLVSLGIAGSGIFLLLVVGVAWRIFLHTVPPWALLGILGSLGPLTTDHYGAILPFVVPYAFLLGVVLHAAVRAERLESLARREGLHKRFWSIKAWPPARGFSLTGALLTLAAADWLHPVPNPDQHFAQRLAEGLDRWFERYSYIVEDFKTNRRWAKHEDFTFSTRRTRLLYLLSALRKLPDVGERLDTTVTVTMPLETSQSLASESLGSVPTLAITAPLRWVVHYAFESDSAKFGEWLANYVGYGPLTRDLVARRIPCGNDATPRLENGYVVTTVRDVQKLFCEMIEGSDAVSNIARKILVSRAYSYGIIRHSGDLNISSCYYFSDISPRFVLEIARLKGSDYDWGIVFAGETRKALGSVDSPEYLALSKLGLLTIRYLGGGAY